MEAVILKGVASFKSSYFIASPPYTAPNKESTSLFESFRSGSLNNERLDISASREGGDVSLSPNEGAPEDVTTFPFPFDPTTSLQGGRVSQPFDIVIPPQGWEG